MYKNNNSNGGRHLGLPVHNFLEKTEGLKAMLTNIMMGICSHAHKNTHSSINRHVHSAENLSFHKIFFAGGNE